MCDGPELAASRANQLADEPESALRIASSGRCLVSSQKSRCGLIGSASCSRALLDQPPPVRDLVLDLRAATPRSVLCSTSGISSSSVALRVADQAELHRVADVQHAAVEVDLHAARLAGLGQELRVRERRADHQQRVALVHQRPARLRAEQADRAGARTAAVVEHGAARAAPSRRRRRASRRSASPRRARRARRGRRGSRPSRPRSGSPRPAAGRRRCGTMRGRAPAGRRVDRAVLARRLGHGRLLAEVVRDDDAGRRCAGRARSGARGRRGGGSARRRSPCSQYSCATSLKSDCRSTSCW